MDIKQQITEWADCALDRCCHGDEEREIKANLELVLFAFDTLTNLKSPVHNEKDALRIRSQASNYMLCDSEFLKMINGDK